jgi:tripartite-type tricarboxylate transporter receptor subunit TctC
VLADAFRKAMDTPQWKKFAEEWHFRPDSYQGPEKFRAWVHGEVTVLEQLVKEFGLRK